MPIWVDIVVALGSGSFGALSTARYKVNSDREERFRDRMIEAADDFGNAASEAFTSLRQACEAARHGDPETIEPARLAAWAKRDRLLQLSARIDLLYEPESPTGLLASSVLHELAKGGLLLNQDLSLVDEVLTTGPQELKKFQLAALTQIVESVRFPTIAMRVRRNFREARNQRRLKSGS